MSRGGRYQAPPERSILLLIDGSGKQMRSGETPSAGSSSKLAVFEREETE